MYMRKLTSQVICNYEDPVAETTKGKVRGLKIDSTYIFRGIKYANAKRFHFPEEVEPWEGIKEAFQFGYVCSELNTPVPHDQYTVPHFFYPQNEDCQYLNIWTQSLSKDAKKPVMVWLHGGGWFSGSSVELLAYDGENLSAYGDVVVVSINHRLNVLGYLDLSEYGEEYKLSKNAGLADLVAALKWVHDNIANFGGDPDNVTIFGQSGGGAKVLSMFQTPAADNLFKRGIMESGGDNGLGGREAAEETAETGRRIADQIVKNLGLTKETIKEIETVDWYDLAQATMEAIWIVREETGKRYMWQPSYDGEYYFGHPLDYGFRKESMDKPLLCGSVLGESTTNFNRVFGDKAKNTWDEETWKGYGRELYGDKIDELTELFKEAYPDRNPVDVLFVDVNRHRVPNLVFTKARAAAGGKTWNWLFNLESPLNYGTMPWHNAEEPYVFHNAEYMEAQYIPEVSEKLQDAMSGTWVKFAKTGNPNNALIPEWPEVTPDSVPTMCFDKVIDVRIDHDRKLMEAFPKPKENGFGGSGKMAAIFGIPPKK